MSETQQTLFNTRACFLIAGACVLRVIVFAFKRPPPIETQSVKVIEPPVAPRVRLANPPVFETQTYYRTIIDNNLFRPLGWTPPRPKEPYRLIGTILPRSANTPPKAILQTTTRQKTYIVSTGEALDADTEVVEIHPKHIVLQRDGKQRTLRLSLRF